MKQVITYNPNTPVMPKGMTGNGYDAAADYSSWTGMLTLFES